MLSRSNTTTYTSGPQTFAVNFPPGIISRDYVRVFVVDNLDGAGDQVYSNFTWNHDGEVLVTDTLTSGDQVTVELNLPASLIVDFLLNGTATRENMDTMYKHLLGVIQGVDESSPENDLFTKTQDLAGRAIVFPTGAVPTSTEVPDVAGRGDKLLGFNTAGDITMLSLPTGAPLLFDTRAAFVAALPLSVVNGTFVYAGGETYVANAASSYLPSLAGYDAYGTPNPYHFGAAGDGTTDDTAALQAWLEYGGLLRGKGGNFLIAAAGMDAGGVQGTITRNTRVVCDPDFVAIAGANLDNNIVQMTATAAGYSTTRLLTFEWFGGTFDQRLQFNSTVVPFSAFYPPANVGTTATADALVIKGEIDDGGTPTAGLERVTIKGLTTIASDTGHWESAGGDGGVFVGGTVHIHVSNCMMIGNRDLGIYASGLSAGSIPGGSCYIGQNKFFGCMFGASTKRLMSNVQLVDNIGYNTAVVVTSTDVTATGDNVQLSRNIGYGAWAVVRATSGTGLVIVGNQSFKHGHLRENGALPTTIFTSTNGCVMAEGVTRSKMADNSVVDLNTGITFTVCAVNLSEDSGGNQSKGNVVHDNSADGVESVVIEITGEADQNTCWENHGKDLTARTVALVGASSVDRDGPFYENNNTILHPGGTGTAVLDTATVPQGGLTRRDRLRIIAAGTMSGTAGSKVFRITIDGATRTFPTLPASTTGGWYIDAMLEFNTEGNQRFMAAIAAGSESAAVYATGNAGFDTGPVDIQLLAQLGNAADTIEVNTFSVRLD